MPSLNDTKCRQAKATDKPYQLQDGGGLYLEVRPSGKKTWRYRYWLNDKDGRLTIGDYPRVSLQDARRAAEDARVMCREGKSPAIAKRIEKLTALVTSDGTFESVAREWIEKKTPTWSQRYRKETVTILEGNIFPPLGSIPIAEIKPATLLGVLKIMEARGAATYANIARSRCSAVFRYAVQNLYCESDPAAMLTGAIIKGKENGARPMSREVIAGLKTRITNYSGNHTTIIAFWMLLLTFVRTIELRRAEWADVDLDGALWTIPADKMKMRRIHLVPLSRQMVEHLRYLKRISGGGRLLFPHLRRPDEMMSVDVINSALKTMGYAPGEWSAHDFRATASTHLHELGYPTEHIEMQLAHADGTVRGIYNHAKYLPDRRVMMQAWADWIDGLSVQ